MCGPNTKLLGFYVMKSAQTHFMSLSQQQGFIQMECWKRWRGDITLTLTHGRAQLHPCSTYQRKRSACEFCASVRTYCIQTTGSFSVAPPSLESDLMVLEPKIGFWNMFHSAYCLKVDYAVTRIVSSFLWIEIQYYNHPKKKTCFTYYKTVCPEEMWSNVVSLSLIHSILLPVQTLNDEFSRHTTDETNSLLNLWMRTASVSLSRFLLFVQKMTSQWRVFGRRTWWTRIWSQSFGKSSAWPTTTSTWSSLTPTWESRWGSFALLSCSICFKIEFPNTSITACLNQKV